VHKYKNDMGAEILSRKNQISETHTYRRMLWSTVRYYKVILNFLVFTMWSLC